VAKRGQKKRGTHPWQGCGLVKLYRFKLGNNELGIGICDKNQTVVFLKIPCNLNFIHLFVKLKFCHIIHFNGEYFTHGSINYNFV